MSTVYFTDELTEVRSMNAANDTDWPALQAVPEDVDIVDTGNVEEVYWVIRGYNGGGAVITGTCDAQLVSVEKNNGATVAVVGSAVESAVPFGAGITTDLKGARFVVPRIANLATTADTLRIFMRRVR